MGYEISIERGDLNYAELEPNYRQHYSEMKARFEADGLPCADFNPQLDRYFDYFRNGGLINYVVRHDGEPVGHANVYITNDMHNGDLIAYEDMIYMLPEHRVGMGRKLVAFIIEDMRKRGVKRGYVTPVTDLRVGKIWKRMGFKPVAEVMVFNMEN